MLIFKNLIVNLFLYPAFFSAFGSIFIAYCGMMFRVKNLIRTFISIEIMFLAISFIFVIVSFSTFNTTSQAFALFVLALAACESALGLSLIILFFRTRGLLTSFETLSSLKG